jgi:DNA repair protein RecN (Recombination protein N)
MLDEHLADPQLLGKVSELYGRYHACRREVDARGAAAENRDSRLDLLRYQLAELKAEVTSVGGIEELFLDQKRIAGRGRLAAAARAALTAAFDGDGQSAHDFLGRAHAALRSAGDSDPKLAEAGGLLAQALINTQEAAEALRRYLDVLDVDPARQDEVERHAAALEALARKHRIGVLELPALLVRIEEELGELDNAERSLASLEIELAALTRDYLAAARALSEARQAAADRLGKRITQLMQTLGMAGGRFAVQVTPSDAKFAAAGADDIEFLVSANPGLAAKSLARVASGGELSRISLAIQLASRHRATDPCRVFDEVDAGIGGAVAEIVGRQLRELGHNGQVLCVTHLAQVASQAHSQFRVSKLTDGKTTRTALTALGPAERVEEIARMLGGIDITDQARAHAREMLARTAQPEAAPAEAAKKKRSR